MNKFKFFREGLKNWRTTGTITPSSKHLCRRMVQHVDFESAKVIVELGAGNGVITKHILKNMSPNTILLCFEVNERFYEHLNQIEDPRLHVILDSAENIGKHLNNHGLKEIDYILSAIPFVSLPQELSRRIITVCRDYLRYDGLFIQFHYSLLVKKLYQSIFGNVNVHWAPINVPPAFVLVSRKDSIISPKGL